MLCPFVRSVFVIGERPKKMIGIRGKGNLEKSLNLERCSDCLIVRDAFLQLCLIAQGTFFC